MPLIIGTNFAKAWPAASVAAAQDEARRAKTRARLADRQGSIQPAAALAVAYRRRVMHLIDEMSKSVSAALGRAYERHDDKLAMISGDGLAYDALAATDLQDVIRHLGHRWERRFDKMAKELAAYFATDTKQRSDAQLQRILRKGGISVKFKLTRPVQEVLRAIINENVALIKSIPQQYLTQVEGSVMRSVTAGRDLQMLTKELREHHGVTKRRAETIARDQTNKATAAIARIRQMDAGIEKAIWLHSHAGREPRPTHVANHGKVYNVAEGWFDPAIKKRIWPGTEVNCRCTAKPILPGMET